VACRRTLGEMSGYNERLFESRSLRSQYHLNRYFWLRQQVSQMPARPKRVIELGCFDAKTLDFLPSHPDYYLGLDAGWEDGLRSAQERWKDNPNIELCECRSPLGIPQRGRFDAGFCLETLEHLDYDLVDSYLAALSRIIDGPLFITVPREHGLIFPLKQLVKRAVFGSKSKNEGYDYSFRDFCMLTLGRTEAVERLEHKGFDERTLVRIVARYFRVDSISGIFPPRMPQALSFAVGIVVRPKG
jgi:hypothetical protein